MDKGGYGTTRAGALFGCVFDGVSSGGPTSVHAAQSFTKSTLTILNDDHRRPNLAAKQRKILGLFQRFNSAKKQAAQQQQRLDTLREFGSQMFDYAALLGPPRAQQSFDGLLGCNDSMSTIPEPDTAGEGGSATGVFVYVSPSQNPHQKHNKQQKTGGKDEATRLQKQKLQVSGASIGDAVALVLHVGTGHDKYDPDEALPKAPRPTRVLARQLNRTRHSKNTTPAQVTTATERFIVKANQTHAYT